MTGSNKTKISFNSFSGSTICCVHQICVLVIRRVYRVATLSSSRTTERCWLLSSNQTVTTSRRMCPNKRTCTNYSLASGKYSITPLMEVSATWAIILPLLINSIRITLRMVPFCRHIWQARVHYGCRVSLITAGSNAVKCL